MNNRRLLTWLLAAIMSGGGVHAQDTCRRVVSIEEIFDSAEANSAQLRPFLRAEEEARKGIEVAKSDRLPDINASLRLSFIGNGFTTRRDFSDFQKAPIPHFGEDLGINVSQPLFTGGALTGAVELAELKSTALRHASDRQRDNIRFRLVGMYLDIYKCNNLRGVVEKSISRAEKVVEEMKARYAQGVALRNDITRYELMLFNLKLQLVRIDNTLDILNRNLVTIAGLPQNLRVVPDSALLHRALPSADEAWWQSEASGNSPRLKIVGSEAAISSKAEKIVKSERYPKVNLQAGWSLNGPILTEIPPINRNLSYWYVGVGVSYNLSSLYKTNKSLARSRQASLLAAERLESERENVSLDVNTDYVRYREDYEDLKTREKSVELAVRNYNTIATRYTAGTALITDLLDAADSRLDAETGLVNSRIDIIYYYYKLLFTSGKI